MIYENKMDELLTELYSNKELLVFCKGNEWFYEKAYAIIEEHSNYKFGSNDVNYPLVLACWELDNDIRYE